MRKRVGFLTWVVKNQKVMLKCIWKVMEYCVTKGDPVGWPCLLLTSQMTYCGGEEETYFILRCGGEERKTTSYFGGDKYFIA